MTLNDIIVAALAQLDRSHDAQNLDTWRDKFTRFADEAIIDLAQAVKPRRCDELTVQDGAIDIRLLPRQCKKVLSIKRGGALLYFKAGQTSTELMVPGAQDGDAVLVTYICVPATLSSPTDEPELPQWCHGLIVTYVVARERSAGEVGIQRGSNIYFQMYYAGKANIRPHLGDPDSYRLLNRW